MSNEAVAILSPGSGYGVLLTLDLPLEEPKEGSVRTSND